MTLIDIYKVSEEKESLNEVTNGWKTCSIKSTSQDPDIWFNELYNINMKQRLMYLTPYLRNTSLSRCSVTSALPRYPTRILRKKFIFSGRLRLAESIHQKIKIRKIINIG